MEDELLDELWLGKSPDPSEEFEKSEFWEEVLEELEPIDKSIVVARFVHGLSVKEVAEMLNLTPTNVTSRLNRAKKKLQNRLSPYL